VWQPLRSDGCPDLDNDADGIVDASDACPLEQEDADGDADEDGCPEPDALEPEATEPTCPDGARPTPDGQCLARLEARAIRLTEPIQFASDAAQLAPDSRAALNQVVDILDENPALSVQIVGHTDSAGPSAVNQHLSLLRARAVRWYLLDQSRNPEALEPRLEAIGRGESEPVADNATAVGRAQNRRVEFLVVAGGSGAAPGGSAAGATSGAGRATASDVDVIDLDLDLDAEADEELEASPDASEADDVDAPASDPPGAEPPADDPPPGAAEG
jgi:outer membrane protein OmpA-like peptidoglycan-associated protein